MRALATCLPKATPASLTRAQVTEWLRHERETRGNSAKTLEKKGTLVGALFSVTVKDELLEKNPFAGFDYSRFTAKEGLADPNEREPAGATLAYFLSERRPLLCREVRRRRRLSRPGVDTTTRIVLRSAAR